MNLTENGKRIGFPRKPARKCTHPSYNNMPVCQTHSDRWQASSIYFLFIYGRRLRDWDTRCLAPLYLAFPPPPALLSLLWARVQARPSPCAAWLVTWKSFNRHEATNKHVPRRGSWILHWNVAFRLLFGKFRLPRWPCLPNRRLGIFFIFCIFNWCIFHGFRLFFLPAQSHASTIRGL